MLIGAWSDSSAVACAHIIIGSHSGAQVMSDTDRQKERQTDRQTDRQIDRHIYSHTER